MSAAMTDANNPYLANPHYWIGTLAASIHGHLNHEQPPERLEHDYREFMDSPCCEQELREYLEPETDS